MYGLVDVEIVKEIGKLRQPDNEAIQVTAKKPGIVAQLIEGFRQKPAKVARSDQGRQTTCAEAASR